MKIYSTNFDQCHVTMNHKDYSIRQQNDRLFLHRLSTEWERPIQPAFRAVPAPRPPAPRSAPAPSFSATPALPYFRPAPLTLRSRHMTKTVQKPTKPCYLLDWYKTIWAIFCIQFLFWSEWLL